MHHCTKFRQNRLFRCGDIAILRIFKMAPAAILYFCNREILLVIAIHIVETHQYAKFRQNRSTAVQNLVEIRPWGASGQNY